MSERLSVYYNHTQRDIKTRFLVVLLAQCEARLHPFGYNDHHRGKETREKARSLDDVMGVRPLLWCEGVFLI